MYEQTFSRQNPGCIIFLVDRSDSMKEPWAGTGSTLAEGAAQAINKILFELGIKSTKKHGVPMYLYFSVGIYGYGRAHDVVARASNRPFPRLSRIAASCRCRSSPTTRS